MSISPFRLSLSAAGRSVPVGFLRRNIRLAHGIMRSPLRSLSVAVVGDAGMRRLHKQFMRIDEPTDVLTFPLEFDRKNRCVEGQIAVCSAKRRNARIHGTAERNELLLYCVHGMLHLKGMDDRTDAEFRQMHRMEDSILRKLGIGPVFDAKGRR